MSPKTPPPPKAGSSSSSEPSSKKPNMQDLSLDSPIPPQTPPPRSTTPIRMSSREYFSRMNEFNVHPKWDECLSKINEEDRMNIDELEIITDINVVMDAYCSYFKNITSHADTFLFAYISEKVSENGSLEFNIREIQFDFASYLIRDSREAPMALGFIREKAVELISNLKPKPVISWNMSVFTNSITKASIYFIYKKIIKCVAFLIEFSDYSPINDVILSNFCDSLLDLSVCSFNTLFLDNGAKLVVIIQNVYTFYKNYKHGSVYLNEIQKFYLTDKDVRQNLYEKSRIRKMTRLSCLNILDMQAIADFSLPLNELPFLPIGFKSYDFFKQEGDVHGSPIIKYDDTFIENLSKLKISTSIMCSDVHPIISLEENLKRSLWTPLLFTILENEFEDPDTDFFMEFSLSSLVAKKTTGPESAMDHKADYALVKTLDIAEEHASKDALKEVCLSKGPRRMDEETNVALGSSKGPLKMFVLPLYLVEVATLNLFHESYHKDHQKVCIDLSRIIMRKVGAMEAFEVGEIAKIRAFASLISGSEIYHLLAYPILLVDNDRKLIGFSVAIASSIRNWKFDLFNEGDSKFERNPHFCSSFNKFEPPMVLAETPEDKEGLPDNVLPYKECLSYFPLPSKDIMRSNGAAFNERVHHNYFPSYKSYDISKDAVASIISMARMIKEYSAWFDSVISDSRFNPSGDVLFCNTPAVKKRISSIDNQSKHGQSSSPSSGTSSRPPSGSVGGSEEGGSGASGSPLRHKGQSQAAQTTITSTTTLNVDEDKRKTSGKLLYNGSYEITKEYLMSEEQILHSKKLSSAPYHPRVHRSKVQKCGKMISYEMENLEIVKSFVDGNYHPAVVGKWSGFSVGFLLDTLSGLLNLHREGYVHGDISPANIGHSKDDGCWKLFDFGQTFRSSQMRREGRGGTLDWRDRLLYDEKRQRGVFCKESDLFSLMSVFVHYFVPEPEMISGSAHFARKVALSVLNCKTIAERPSVAQCLRTLVDSIEDCSKRDEHEHLYAKAIQRSKFALSSSTGGDSGDSGS